MSRQQLNPLLVPFNELELLEVVLNLFSRDINVASVISDDEKSSVAKHIAQNLLLLGARCSLKIMIDMEEKEEIPWADLVVHPHPATDPQQPEKGQLPPKVLNSRRRKRGFGTVRTRT